MKKYSMILRGLVAFLQKKAGHETFELPPYFFKAARKLRGTKIGQWTVTSVGKGSNGEFEFKGTWGPEDIYIGFQGANDQEPEWVWELVIEKPVYYWEEAEYGMPEVEHLGYPPKDFSFLFSIWVSGGEFEFDQEWFDKYAPAELKPFIMKYVEEERKANPEENYIILQIPRKALEAEMEKVYSPTPEAIMTAIKKIIFYWKKKKGKFQD